MLRNCLISILAFLVSSGSVLVCPANEYFLEAEAFSEVGGWSIDTSFTQIVGSPYLLAHGLGKPVADAQTTIQVDQSDKYRLWVRTKDWVAPWNAPGTPGRFEVLLNGKSIGKEFGTVGKDWHWQDGGQVELIAGSNKIALHDLTGFDGRCDAILLTTDLELTPPNDHSLALQRKKWLGLPEQPESAGEFDLVVIGGGYAGIATAISAARQSLHVAFIQDRFVLGGNGSSETRVWAQGGTMRGKYPHLGEIVEEFADHATDSPGLAEQFQDDLKEKLVRNEKNIELFLGHYALGVETAPDGRILSVSALEVRTSRERQFRGKLFCDCTGHGTVGALAGAKHHMEPSGRMGMSNMWYWQNLNEVQKWPETPWALSLTLDDFPKTVKSAATLEGKPFMKGEWFWESGFNKHPIEDLELIRDWNLRAVYGAFTTLKTGPEKDQHSNAALLWVAHVGGPRESRLLEGDVVLQREDIVSGREFPDGMVPTTWDIDLHYPKEQYAKKFADNPFISRAEFGAGVDRKNGYPVPYRCFYSKNIPNLFMAGRCISVNHEALGTVRVMRTCGMMGEVVGKAAYLCIRHDASPRQVYELHLNELIDLVSQPGNMRRERFDSELFPDKNLSKVTGYFSKAADRGAGIPSAEPKSVSVKNLPGIVVDDKDAKMTGAWTKGTGLQPYIGEGYQYAAANTEASARFEFDIPEPGKYEVRIAWVPHENRSKKAACLLERTGNAAIKLRLNMQEATEDNLAMHSLGVVEFEKGPGAIVLTTEGSDGFIHADAIQLLKK